MKIPINRNTGNLELKYKTRKKLDRQKFQTKKKQIGGIEKIRLSTSTKIHRGGPIFKPTAFVLSNQTSKLNTSVDKTVDRTMAIEQILKAAATTTESKPASEAEERAAKVKEAAKVAQAAKVKEAAESKSASEAAESKSEAAESKPEAAAATQKSKTLANQIRERAEEMQKKQNSRKLSINEQLRINKIRLEIQNLGNVKGMKLNDMNKILLKKRLKNFNEVESKLEEILGTSANTKKVIDFFRKKLFSYEEVRDGKQVRDQLANITRSNLRELSNYIPDNKQTAVAQLLRNKGFFQRSKKVALPLGQKIAMQLPRTENQREKNLRRKKELVNTVGTVLKDLNIDNTFVKYSISNRLANTTEGKITEEIARDILKDIESANEIIKQLNKKGLIERPAPAPPPSKSKPPVAPTRINKGPVSKAPVIITSDALKKAKTIIFSPAGRTREQLYDAKRIVKLYKLQQEEAAAKEKAKMEEMRAVSNSNTKYLRLKGTSYDKQKKIYDRIHSKDKAKVPFSGKPEQLREIAEQLYKEEGIITKFSEKGIIGKDGSLSQSSLTNKEGIGETTINKEKIKLLRNQKINNLAKALGEMYNSNTSRIIRAQDALKKGDNNSFNALKKELIAVVEPESKAEILDMAYKSIGKNIERATTDQERLNSLNKILQLENIKEDLPTSQAESRRLLGSLVATLSQSKNTQVLENLSKGLEHPIFRQKNGFNLSSVKEQIDEKKKDLEFNALKEELKEVIKPDLKAKKINDAINSIGENIKRASSDQERLKSFNKILQLEYFIKDSPTSQAESKRLLDSLVETLSQSKKIQVLEKLSKGLENPIFRQNDFNLSSVKKQIKTKINAMHKLSKPENTRTEPEQERAKQKNLAKNYEKYKKMFYSKTNTAYNLRKRINSLQNLTIPGDNKGTMKKQLIEELEAALTDLKVKETAAEAKAAKQARKAEAKAAKETAEREKAEVKAQQRQEAEIQKQKKTQEKQKAINAAEEAKIPGVGVGEAKVRREAAKQARKAEAKAAKETAEREKAEVKAQQRQEAERKKAELRRVKQEAKVRKVEAEAEARVAEAEARRVKAEAQKAEAEAQKAKAEVAKQKAEAEAQKAEAEAREAEEIKGRGRGRGRGRGNSSRGRGNEGRGRGNSSRGRGNEGRGRGNVGRGRGNVGRGRGRGRVIVERNKDFTGFGPQKPSVAKPKAGSPVVTAAKQNIAKILNELSPSRENVGPGQIYVKNGQLYKKSGLSTKMSKNDLIPGDLSKFMGSSPAYKKKLLNWVENANVNNLNKLGYSNLTTKNLELLKKGLEKRQNDYGFAGFEVAKPDKFDELIGKRARSVNI